MGFYRAKRWNMKLMEHETDGIRITSPYPNLLVAVASVESLLGWQGAACDGTGDRADGITER